MFGSMGARYAVFDAVKVIICQIFTLTSCLKSLPSAFKHCEHLLSLDEMRKTNEKTANGYDLDFHLENTEIAESKVSDFPFCSENKKILF